MAESVIKRLKVMEHIEYETGEAQHFSRVPPHKTTTIEIDEFIEPD